MANTFSEPKPTTFRVNTLKAGVIAALPHSRTGHEWLPLREKLEHAGFRLEQVPWYRDAFILREGRLRDLQETEIYQKGEIYVQNLSSMVPALVLDPQPGEKILDLTAAPGSKTTQIACLMKGEGKIVANDNHRVRFFKLKANVEMQGASAMTQGMCEYGESFGKRFPETFDRVLLDAPCSAEGRFNLREPSTYGYWKPNKIKEMAYKQKKLLLAAVAALRPGGVLVYSTCTFAPEENESVLNWAFEKWGDKIQLEKIPLSFPNVLSGLSKWKDQSFHPSVPQAAVRILPTPIMEGFFLAKIRKK